MLDNYWFDRLLRKIHLPYPATLAVVSVLLYGAGVALSVWTENLSQFLAEPGWIILSGFGLLSGTGAIYAIRQFDSALCDTKSLSRLRDDEFQRMKEKLSLMITSNLYWVVVVFWIVFSLSHVIKGQSWWRSGVSYNHPLLIDLYGFLIQGWNGCLLGGMFLFTVPISLNFAYARICSLRYFGSEIATEEGVRDLSSFNRLITVNTLAAAVMSVLAIALWAKPAYRYVPLFGSAFMFLPTAIIPHYLFHTVLSTARREKLDAIAKDIDMIAPERREPSIGDLITLHKLLREEARAEKVKTWLVDLSTVVELFLAVLVPQLISFVLASFVMS